MNTIFFTVPILLASYDSSYMNEEIIQSHSTAMQLICQSDYNQAKTYKSISNYVDKIDNKKDYVKLQFELKNISYSCNYHEFRNYLIELNKKK